MADSRVWQQRIQIFSTDGVGWQTVESDSQKLKFLIDSGRWQTAESESQKSIFLLILAGGRQKSLTVQKLTFIVLMVADGRDFKAIIRFIHQWGRQQNQETEQAYFFKCWQSGRSRLGPIQMIGIRGAKSHQTSASWHPRKCKSAGGNIKVLWGCQGPHEDGRLTQFLN